MNRNTAQNEDYYLKVKEIIEDLIHSGMLRFGSGYCLSMSDVVLKLLHKEGIRAEMIECNLMVMMKEPPGLVLVGYRGFMENTLNSGQKIDNHVVCITKTKIPILIDLSVSHIDPKVQYICEPILDEHPHTDLAEFDFPSSTWTYQSRNDSELPKLHQKSILNRIKTDIRIDKEITFIKYFLFILFAVSSLNFTRGVYEFYYTFVNPEAHPTRYLEPRHELEENEKRNKQLRQQIKDETH
jgi:hypothetical protein